MTEFFEPIAYTMIFVGDLALSAARYGIGVGVFVAMSYGFRDAYLHIPFTGLLDRAHLTILAWSLFTGVLIGIVRATRDQRLSDLDYISAPAIFPGVDADSSPAGGISDTGRD